jgi:tetratricopeptide (TPR) repeat protein
MFTLWALAGVVYSNSFRAGLVFDSAIAITQDPRVHAATAENLHRIWNEEYWHGSTTSGLYRPLTTLSYLFNYAVLGNGTDPAGYHWVNLGLHEANVSLAYLLGLAVMGSGAPAFALAALWGAHPLLTEAVTDIVGRADLLAAFGVLAGLLCYLRSGNAAGNARLLWLAAMALAQAVGLFSKESAAVLPALMLLYDVTWAKRDSWRRGLAGYAWLAPPFLLYLYCRGAQALPVVARMSDNPLAGAGFWTGRLTAIKVIGKYLWLFMWPAQLSADYSYNAVPLFGWHPTRWEDAAAPIALGICVTAGLLALHWRRTHRAVLFFAGFFFIALFPVSNLAVPIGSIMAERFVYLPSIGLAGCAVLAIFGICRRLRAPRAAWAAVALLCLACGARSFARNADWQDERSLWGSAVAVCPENAKAHRNLASALAQWPGGLPEAVMQYEAALRIRPDYAEAHNGLGNALSVLPGRLPDAIAQYRAAVASKPDYAEAHYNLGNALARVPGRLPEAIAEYRRALEIEPDDARANNNLGLALTQSGQAAEAIRAYRAALRADPDLAEAHNNLGNALVQSAGSVDEAIGEYEAAIRAEPRYAEAHNNLGVALASGGRLREAIAQFEDALKIQPDYEQARSNLRDALAEARPDSR